MAKGVEDIDGVEEGQPGELPPAAARAVVEQGVGLRDAVQAGVEHLRGMQFNRHFEFCAQKMGSKCDQMLGKLQH